MDNTQSNQRTGKNAGRESPTFRKDRKYQPKNSEVSSDGERRGPTRRARGNWRKQTRAESVDGNAIEYNSERFEKIEDGHGNTIRLERPLPEINRHPLPQRKEKKEVVQGQKTIQEIREGHNPGNNAVKAPEANAEEEDDGIDWMQTPDVDYTQHVADVKIELPVYRTERMIVYEAAKEYVNKIYSWWTNVTKYAKSCFYNVLARRRNYIEGIYDFTTRFTSLTVRKILGGFLAFNWNIIKNCTLERFGTPTRSETIVVKREIRPMKITVKNERKDTLQVCQVTYVGPAFEQPMTFSEIFNGEHKKSSPVELVADVHRSQALVANLRGHDPKTAEMIVDESVRYTLIDKFGLRDLNPTNIASSRIDGDMREKLIAGTTTLARFKYVDYCNSQKIHPFYGVPRVELSWLGSAYTVIAFSTKVFLCVVLTAGILRWGSIFISRTMSTMTEHLHSAGRNVLGLARQLGALFHLCHAETVQDQCSKEQYNVWAEILTWIRGNWAYESLRHILGTSVPSSSNR